ncbi:MAG: RHS repeat-associated core domain-containing protein, partial [Desulfobacterales bacterium]|nr:RHS repeat-associated core domain-containing protein [Desulfobacterales bacterium]
TPLSAAAEAGLPEGTYPEKPSPCYEITHVHTDYDGNSNVTKITETKNDPDGTLFTDVTESIYDDSDRPDYTTQRGMMTDYDYDGNGSRTLVSVLSGSTSYTYDKRNRLKTAGADENRRRGKQQGPDDPPDKNATASYTYTPDGKPDTVTYISRASVKYNYNDQNRTESITHRSGTGEIISRYEYTYDKNGNRKTLAETQNGITEKTEYNYDAADRLEDYTVKDSQSITATKYSYEGYNRKSENTFIIYFGPTEESIEELKNEDVPEEVTGKLAGLAGFEFATEDSFLNALKLAIGEGNTALYSPVIFKAAQGEKPLRAREYEYEDNSDQLETVTHTDWIETVDDTDPDNPVSVRTPVTKNLSYTYDDNGSTVTKTDSLNPSDSLTFDYDARNRTVRIMKNGTEAGLYDYNAYGMKVRHYSGGRGDVDYYYDGTSVIEERKTDGNLLAHYRYADRLFRLDTQTYSQYYHHDALGSTVNLTGSDGSAEVSYRLDPWGKIRQQTGTTFNRQIFTGQEYDENTGLTDFGARLYDPDTARFTVQDPYLGEIGIPPSRHRYTYAYSNPLFYTDPTGNFSFKGAVYGASTIITEPFKMGADLISVSLIGANNKLYDYGWSDVRIYGEDVTLLSAIGKRQMRRLAEGKSRNQTITEGFWEFNIHYFGNIFTLGGFGLYDNIRGNLKAYERGEISLEELDYNLSAGAGAQIAAAGLAKVAYQSSRTGIIPRRTIEHKITAEQYSANIVDMVEVKPGYYIPKWEASPVLPVKSQVNSALQRSSLSDLLPYPTLQKSLPVPYRIVGKSETLGSFTNLGSAPKAHNVVSYDSYIRDDAGFSGAYDIETGKWLAYPSGKTKLIGGGIPENLVSPAGGHEDVNLALTELLGSHSNNRLGLVIVFDDAGDFEVRWNSGMINAPNPNFEGRTVPEEYRQQVLNAIMEATGRKAYTKKP